MSASRTIRCVGVVGAGQMGRGIARVMAASRLKVRLLDADSDALNRSVAQLHSELNRLIDKGKLKPKERDTLVARIAPTTDLASFGACDFAVEATTEDLHVKQAVFRDLDRYMPGDAILASNTSSISVTKLAGVTERPEHVIGMHFMNPVPRMPLVELVRALQTSDATYEATRKLATRLGKTCITTKDMPGFVVNRMLIPFINEACFVLQEGLSTVEDIDQAAELGLSHPMGPLKLADLIGLDTCLAIAEVLQQELGEDKYRPAAILRNYVAAGWLGRKTGRGFYDYSAAVEKQRKVA